MAVFETIGYIYARLAYCVTCGRNLPYVDEFGQDRKRIYAWQLENYSYVHNGVKRFTVCPLCNKPANKWGKA